MARLSWGFLQRQGNQYSKLAVSFFPSSFPPIMFYSTGLTPDANLLIDSAVVCGQMQATNKAWQWLVFERQTITLNSDSSLSLWGNMNNINILADRLTTGFSRDSRARLPAREDWQIHWSQWTVVIYIGVSNEETSCSIWQQPKLRCSILLRRWQASYPYSGCRKREWSPRDIRSRRSTLTGCDNWNFKMKCWYSECHSA